MIEAILPPSVASAAAYEDDDDDAALFAEEEALVARAVEARRRSFATARACARRALGELGLPPVAILRGESGEPRWPPGVVGSITHCAGYRAAAVAWRRDVAALGIDAEPHEPLRRGLLGRIARAEEEDRLRALAAADASIHWDRLLFSAKESVYKAWFPLAGTWLGFHDAAVTINTAGALSVNLLVDGPPATEFEGRWIARDGLVVTAIVVPGR